MTPDMTHGLDFDGYRDLGAVNFSTLKEMEKSPAHYLHRLTNPRADTGPMRFGRAVHTAVLEPDRFPLMCAVFDGAIRRGKEWDAFEAANADKTILKADEYATCLAVRDAVRANKDAARLLTGQAEITVTWTDAETGLACKGRVDHLLGDTLVDLKSTVSVDAWTFAGTFARMLYHAQLAFYARGLFGSWDAGQPNPRIIAVESEPPHDVAVFVVTDDAMLAGDQLITDWMRTLARCQESGEWPGRYSGEQELELPVWAQADPEGYGITIGGVDV